MTRRYVVVIASVLMVAAGACQTDAGQESLGSQPSSSEFLKPTFEFEEIRDDVYLATGSPASLAGCNAAIIINESDVVIVDSNISPQAAAIMLEGLREITSKPIRYVINTHFHFDHVYGNQLYAADAEIIGHEFTRDAIDSRLATSGRTYDLFIASMPTQIASLRERIDKVSDAEDRTNLEQRLAIQESAWAAIQTVEHISPEIVLSDHLTLYRGTREIRILYFGRGHTGGDVVVYLPQERILITGDLIYERLSYMGDAYFEDWVETLEKLKSLDFDWFLPGHGAAFQNRSRIDYFESYLYDFWQRATEQYEAGVSIEEAAERIDMRDHSEHYPQIEEVGVSLPAMERAYELLDQRTDR